MPPNQATPNKMLDSNSVKSIIRSKSSKVIEKAYLSAKQIHKGHLRLSGEPYLTHLEGTADLILGWLTPKKVTHEYENLISAALLHDSVEYMGTDLNLIDKEFNRDIRNLVEGVSDMRSDQSKGTEDENLRFIARKGYLDPRVFVIKIADRLHNMRTHKFLPPEKIISKAKETMKVYVKLAESMGLWIAKKELEDLCFFYLSPKIFSGVKEKIEKDPRLRAKFIDKTVKDLKIIFAKSKIRYNIQAQTNGLWTLYQKKEIAIEKGEESPDKFFHISDVVTFSVVTENEDPIPLYTLMGFLHNSKKYQKYVDIYEINDYISKPQINNYSSLQTTLNLPEGHVEVVFATKNRFEFNNLGIVALIKNNVSNLNIYKRNIIFDENGEAWFLPLNATYVDYAYIKNIGPVADHAIVNGRKVALTEKIENATMPVIVLKKSESRAPNPSYLKFVLPETKSVIEDQLNLKNYDKLITKGKTAIEKILKPRGILDLSDFPAIRNTIVYSLSLKDLNDLYQRVARESLNLPEVSKIMDRFEFTKEKLKYTTVRISGKNKPGILNDITKILREKGGDISQIHQTEPTKATNFKFVLRLVLKGIKISDIAEIKQTLSKDSRLSSVEVV